MNGQEMASDFWSVFWVGVGINAAICSLLGVYVSCQKNRSVIEGLILGGLFGLIGVIVVALLPQRDSRDQQYSSGQHPMDAAPRDAITESIRREQQEKIDEHAMKLLE